MKKPLPFILVLLLLCCASCGTNTVGKSNNPTINSEETKALVYRSAWADEYSVTVTLVTQYEPSYTFILTSGGELVTIRGMASARHKAGDSVTANDYAIQKLSDKEREKFDALKNGVGAFQGDNSNASDVWYASYYAGGAEYHFNYGGSVNDRYDELITAMIVCSALPVVGIHGESVVPFTD